MSNRRYGAARERERGPAHRYNASEKPIPPLRIGVTRTIAAHQNAAEADSKHAGMRIFGFAGWSGSGKTTLIERIVPRLVARGLVISLVKHAHHAFDIDQPGKDSFRHREAGCTEVLVSSASRWALIHELRGDAELTLERALARLSDCDIALVEGYKAYPIPKLEVWRVQIGKPLLHPRDEHIVAVATDSPEALPSDTQRRLPVFALSDIDGIATFVESHAAAGPVRN